MSDASSVEANGTGAPKRDRDSKITNLQGEMTKVFNDPNMDGAQRRDFFIRHFKEGVNDIVQKRENNALYFHVANDMFGINEDGAFNQSQFDQAALVLSNVILDPQTQQVGIEILGRVYQHSRVEALMNRKENKQGIEDKVIRPMIDVLPMRLLASVYSFDYDSDSIQKDIIERRVRPLLTSYGLDPDDLFTTWMQDGHRKRGGLRDINKVADIEALEESRKGSAQVLLERFGIKDFYRYPTEVLIDMFDNRDNIDVSFGMMMYDQQDNPNDIFSKGAFNDEKEKILKLYNRLKRLGIHLRIFEFNDSRSAFGVFQKTKDKYLTKSDGAPNKIRFVIYASHGEEGTMGKGVKSTKIGRVRMEHFNRTGVQNIGNMLADDATLIFDSCSVGAAGGIGEVIQRTYGRKVIAPVTGAILDEIIVPDKLTSDGKLSLDARYTIDVVKRVIS